MALALARYEDLSSLLVVTFMVQEGLRQVCSWPAKRVHFVSHSLEGVYAY